MATLVALAALPVTAQAEWTEIGPQGFTGKEADETSVAVASDGTPYVGYETGTMGAATVRKFDFASDSWEIVGTENFSQDAAESPELGVNEDTPYIVYSDVDKSEAATVEKFDGNNWVPVGNRGFSDGRIQSPSLAFDSAGTPYVAYQDLANNEGPTVEKFDDESGSWEVVGTKDFDSGTTISTISLAFDDADTPHVAYQGSTAGPITVERFDNTWSELGDPLPEAGKAGDDPSLGFGGNGTPFVAYQDETASEGATVEKFDGQSWTSVGTTGFSKGTVIDPEIAFDGDGSPYVGYNDKANGNGATVQKFENGGWQALGAAAFSDGKVQTVRLAFSPEGPPFVAYRDRSTMDNEATVQSFPSISLAQESYTVAEGDGPLTVSVRRAVVGPADVTVETRDGSGSDGAVATSDYTSVSETRSWAADAGPGKTVDVPITDDSDAEGEETFTVALSNPEGAEVRDVTTATVTITDDDAAGGGGGNGGGSSGLWLLLAGLVGLSGVHRLRNRG